MSVQPATISHDAKTGATNAARKTTLPVVLACLLLLLMAALAGGAALRESITVDEIAHIAAGVTYWQKLDLRLNEEHPPLPKLLATLPVVLRGAHADYTNPSWTVGTSFFPAYAGQWVFGEYFIKNWNDARSTLAWARAPMLLLTLLLGWIVFAFARRLGGDWAALLCLAVYVSTPMFLAFGPLVHTDIPVTLFSLLTLWTFASIWRDPARKNVALFALTFAGALLSKFTAGILLFVFVAFALSTRWRALAAQPADKSDARTWRKVRSRATWRGIFWAALIVYIVYFVFSIRQPTDAVDLLGHGPALGPLRRLLMPAWLYIRGVLFVFATGSRPTFILGRSYPHGVWFYFPVVFALKSPLGFLGLLALALGLALFVTRTNSRTEHAAMAQPIVPEEYSFHWRAIWLALVVFTGFCLVSRLDLSIRHFSVPLILLILLLAPLPRLLGQVGQVGQVRQRAAPDAKILAAKILAAAVVVLAASCLFTAARAYPFYFPYINPLSFGRPAYALLNDSNVDWNQSLPEAKRFADAQGIQSIALDDYALDDGSSAFPNSRLWNCQQPTSADAGQWVIVSANMILDGHNCKWLMSYPNETLAAGSMFAIHLPDQIPPPGADGGPRLPAAYRQFLGANFDIRAFFTQFVQHPDRLPKSMQEAQAMFQSGSTTPAPGPNSSATPPK